VVVAKVARPGCGQHRAVHRLDGGPHRRW
jgi:hypothetical protein